MSKFGNDELHRRIDEVLFYVWDPIGVCGEPCCRGEYGTYAYKVRQLVEDNDDMEAISAYLVEVERDLMGLRPDKKKCDRVAELVLRYKKAVKEG